MSAAAPATNNGRHDLRLSPLAWVTGPIASAQVQAVQPSITGGRVQRGHPPGQAASCGQVAVFRRQDPDPSGRDSLLWMCAP